MRKPGQIDDDEKKRGRGWVFTLNNYTNQECEEIKSWDCRCIVAGLETGEKGTPHVQGAVYFHSLKSLRTLKKLQPRAHWLKMCGTWKQASDYARKDGDILIDEGEPPEQGKRTDVLHLKEKIDEGGTIEDCYELDFTAMTRVHKSIKEYQDIKRRRLHRTWMTEGVWFWGETGVGKSHKAFENYNPDTTYVWKSDNGWWDAYDGQEVVIMNDFRADIKYNELLQLVDKWPHMVSRRGREPTPFLAKKVIITSSLPPEEVYHNVNEKDSIAQLKRRFTIINLTK